jgi:bacterioferritin-associated ferredoxin
MRVTGGAVMGVDRCICHNVTFKHLLELAKHLGADFEKLQEATKLGTTCGMCQSYARIALCTGKSRLPVMSDATLARTLAQLKLHDQVTPGGGDAAK